MIYLGIIFSTVLSIAGDGNIFAFTVLIPRKWEQIQCRSDWGVPFETANQLMTGHEFDIIVFIASDKKQILL